MKRLYVATLLIFGIFVVSVNTISFMTCFNKRQLVNFFYLSERVSSITKLAEHIVFESGLIIKKESLEKVSEYINDVCKDTAVDPLLVYTMVTVAGLDPYAIDFDGSMGYMRVKPHVAGKFDDKDPYIAKDNIYMGVAHLSELIKREGDVEKALQLYYTPEKAYGAYNHTVVYAISHAVFSSYTGNVAVQSSISPQ